MDKALTPSGHVWDSGTGVPGMLKHNLTGRYYTRFQVGGKRTMKALKTKVWSVAKLRHLDKIAQVERLRQQQHRLVEGTGLMGDLIEQHRKEYLADTNLSESSKTGLGNSIDRLVRHWRGCFGSDIGAAKPAQITDARARRFANYLHGEAVFRKHNTKKHRKGYGAVTVNKTIELLHRVLRIGVSRGAIGAVPFELDPAIGGSIRKSERRKKLRLPSSAQMQEVFAHMRLVSDELGENQLELRDYLIARASASADLAEFMAYSGARVGEASTFTWEDDLANSIILRGTKSEGSEDREVPKIPALRELLKQMRQRHTAAGRKPKGKVFSVMQCREALETACRKAGVDRLTHHSLRHFFATVCIESGVDIPTISRWLGHADGGVLAMQTYGHLRTEHSFAAAAKVSMG